MPPMKRGPPAALRIDSAKLPHIALDSCTLSSTSGLSSAASESDVPPFNRPNKPRSLQNMKKLSLNLPSAQSSAASLALPPVSGASSIKPDPPKMERQRRPSVISLPPTTGNPIATTRKVEDGSPTVPYLDGPIQIIPGIWLGAEENAKDWAGLRERGIKSILNVAKEVVSPFDNLAGSALRGFSSTPNLSGPATDSDPTFYPANITTGRPAMHYLKLQWSHGQQHLVENGFPEAMAFTDGALERGDGVLIHCQCGISRSATLVIALVMRAAAERSPSVPSEIWALKGMQGAYTFLKEKSKWVGPNMSLIYQLLDYEKKLRGDSGDLSGTESGAEDEEWGRRRLLLDEAATDDDEDDREDSLVMREAQYLDKAMEQRFLARKTSASSVASSSSGVGMGAAWRNRYGARKRAGSIASNMTNGSSILSEDLVEEDEEQELLGIGGGFDDDRGSSAEPDSQSSPEDDVHSAVTPRRPGGLPSAPVWKTSFNIPPPATAFRPTFNLPLAPKTKRRPTPLGSLAAVPPSPVRIIVESNEPETPSKPSTRKALPGLSLPPIRSRTESKKPAPPPLHLRTSLKPKTNPPSASGLATPLQTQTLFLFPPSPTTLSSRTPSAMTLSSMNGPLPFPSLTTPRVATFRSEGRTRSFIGLGAPPTPTTAFSKVDARGYFGA